MNLPLLPKEKSCRSLRILAEIAGLICSLVLMAGCRTETEQKWLNLFFDGVPQPGATNGVSRTIATVVVKPTIMTNTATITVKVFSHPPYTKRECTAFHESQFSNAMRGKPGEVCFGCHKELKTNFLAGKVKHQPVEEGNCNSCHNPHSSPNKKLLQKPLPALCLNCHDDPLAAGKFKHQAVEVGDCADCHAPHASNFKGLLKKSVKDTCADCHDDLTAKKKFVHQPAGDGDCLECHTPHAGKIAKLLKKPVKDICAGCHDDIPAKNAKVVHPPVGDGDCTACHNPHATDKKSLVKKSTPALCWDCHDNFLEKAKFKHDVVEDCTGCHKVHQSQENALLAKNILKLCGDCHDEKDMKAVKGHAAAAGQSCTACHDPHVGKDKYLLKAGKEPPAAK